MSNRQPCNFHNKPGGCRNGEGCRFAHNGPSGPGNSTPWTPSNAQQKLRGNAPPGVCSYFLQGHCNRGTSCRFRHEYPNGGSSRASAAGPSTTFVAGFLTEAGAAKVMGAGTDVFFPPSSSDQPMTPTQVHSALRRFLADDYRFNGTMQMYSFLRLLTSANSSNPAWVCPLMPFG